MTETKRTFGQFLAHCRVQKGLTQKQLADLLYVGESAVSKWEKDKRRPDLDLVSSLAEILSVTETELIRASVDKTRLKDKSQARRYRVIANAYTIAHLVAFVVTILTCLIVNLVVSKTLDWFFIVLASLLCYACFYVPLLIKKYDLPAWVKKNNVLIAMGPFIVLILVLLVVIDLYDANAFGWSVKVGFPIVAFWSAVILGTVAIMQYVKVSWHIKVAILISTWLAMINIFNPFLNLIGINDKWEILVMLPIIVVGLISIIVLMALLFIKNKKEKKQ